MFDHQLRRRSASTELNFGRRRQGLVLNDEAAAARVRRHAIVDVWRSIAGPVLDTPLALCDARSVQAAELVAGEVRYARRAGEIDYLGHSPRHRWSYFAAMERDEALVFKQCRRPRAARASCRTPRSTCRTCRRARRRARASRSAAS